MKKSLFIRIAALSVLLFIFGSCGSSTAPSNPFVGSIPTLIVQWGEDMERLEEKFNSSRKPNYEKYEAEKKKINYQYNEKIVSEMKKLVGKTVPCKSLSDICTVVNNEAVCTGGENYLTYRIQVTFNKPLHIVGQLLVWDVNYLDSEGNLIQKGKQTMSPKDENVSISHDFIPGKTYEMSIIFTSFGDDYEVFQKEFSGIAVQPVK